MWHLLFHWDCVCLPPFYEFWNLENNVWVLKIKMASKLWCHSILRHSAAPETGVTIQNQKYYVKNIMPNVSFQFPGIWGLIYWFESRILYRKVYNTWCDSGNLSSNLGSVKDEVLPGPTPEHWRRIEEGFRIRLHFPNCIGALDGNISE